MVNFMVSVTEAEDARLREFFAALRTPCVAQMNQDSTFYSESFESEFQSKLLTHHCYIGSPLYQESFDSAFIAACSRAGHRVEMAPRGQRFWDVVVDGRRISLKSTKAKVLRMNKLHISKLTEGAWIQDCRTAAKRCDATHNLFREYCAQVDAIVQLRYFISQQFYELVEIPVSLLRPNTRCGQSPFYGRWPDDRHPHRQISLRLHAKNRPLGCQNHPCQYQQRVVHRARHLAAFYLVRFTQIRTTSAFGKTQYTIDCIGCLKNQGVSP